MSPFEEVKNFCSELGVTVGDVEAKLCELGSDRSQHYFDDAQLLGFYFAAIALVLKDVKNVLEIGVGQAHSTNHLARLFPNATIYAVDLPPNDKDYQKLASRRPHPTNGNVGRFKENIDMPNIVFIEQNSFFLPLLKLPDEFDLIWVDGDHSFPAVGWDFAFAYSHMKEGGFLFMDDYQDSAVRTTMEYMKARISETVHLLPPQQKEGAAIKIMWLRKGEVKK